MGNFKYRLKLLKISVTETEEQRIIRHANIIVANADYNGELENDCIDIIGILTKEDRELNPILLEIRNELRKLQPDFGGNVDKVTAGIQKNYDDMKNHLLNNGYIDKPNHTQKWLLTEKGKLMKELGGHEQYKKYRRGEVNLIRNQGRINNWLIGATLAAGLVPAMLFTIDKVWFPNHKLSESPPSIEIHADSSVLPNNDEQLKKGQYSIPQLPKEQAPTVGEKTNK